MNEQLIAALIALLVGTVPNLILKWAERGKPREELSKTSIEAANISVDVLQDALQTLKEHNEYLTKKLNKKREEISILESEIVSLKQQLQEATKGK